MNITYGYDNGDNNNGTKNDIEMEEKYIFLKSY